MFPTRVPHGRVGKRAHTHTYITYTYISHKHTHKHTHLHTNTHTHTAEQVSDFNPNFENYLTYTGSFTTPSLRVPRVCNHPSQPCLSVGWGCGEDQESWRVSWDQRWSTHGDTPTRPALGSTSPLVNSLTSCQSNKGRKHNLVFIILKTPSMSLISCLFTFFSLISISQ